MKQIILLLIVGLVVAGCCSTQNEIQRLSTSDLTAALRPQALLEYDAQELGQAIVAEQRV